MSPYNGHMPSWDEWNSQLDEEQRRYHLYNVLNSIDNRMSKADENCSGRVESCNDRFVKIEKRKFWNSAASMVGGVIGGIIAVIGGWAFWGGPKP